MSERIRVLIVEDHIALAENLFEFFSDARYVLDHAADGLTALHLIATNQYDVIVLDVMLPGISGFELCRRVRSESHCTTPIIMITAKDQMDDKEQGFSCGADDYLVKPFNLKELQLRVYALHRRGKPLVTGVIRAGDLSYDCGTLMLHCGDLKPVELTGTAASIFELLMRRYPNIVSYSDFEESIWQGEEVDIHTIRTHAYALRKQLQEFVGQPLIKTVHGRGYRLTPPGEC